jgi:hypothetical protein
LSQTSRIDPAPRAFDSLRLTYRLEASALPRALARGGENNQAVPRDFPPGALATLSIVYPHPDGDPAMALAEVVVEAQPGLNATDDADKKVWKAWFRRIGEVADDVLPGVKLADGVYEAMALGVPLVEVDKAVADLRAAGFFQHPGAGRTGATIVARLDGREVAKSWTRLRSLDDLLSQVRSEGTLISYERPVLPETALSTTPPLAQQSSPSRIQPATPPVIQAGAQSSYSPSPSLRRLPPTSTGPAPPVLTAPLSSQITLYPQETPAYAPPPVEDLIARQAEPRQPWYSGLSPKNWLPRWLESSAERDLPGRAGSPIERPYLPGDSYTSSAPAR